MSGSGRILLKTAIALGLLIHSICATAESLSSYELVASEGRLTPDILHVPAGQRFKIVVRNEGHDAIEFESTDLKKEKVLAPGATSFVVIAPLKPGSYRFFDEFHPDTGQGRIVVE